MALNLNANQLIDLVKGLGLTHKELVATSLIKNETLTPLFNEEENEDLIYKPEQGIELWFWKKTTKLERIVITLIPRSAGKSAYTGELPAPFSHRMDQDSIQKKLGIPDHSKGPAKLPPPFGMTGGWYAYKLDKKLHFNAEVAIQFRADKLVSGLAFRLIEKGHD